MKRQRPSDLHVEETDYTSYFPAVVLDMWRGLTSQEIVALHTTPPTTSGNAPKRRAITREDLQAMPGRFPTSPEPPEQPSLRPCPTTPSPSPPRPGERPAQPPPLSSTKQRVFSWFYSWMEQKQTAVVENAARPWNDRTDANASIAPPVPAKDVPLEPRRSQIADRKYLSINERLDRLRKLEETGQKVPSQLRESYATTTPNREPTQPKTLTPRTEIKNRQRFRRSHQSGLRASTNVVRDLDVEGLLERAKNITIRATEEESFKESHRLRIRRLADEKGVTGRARARQEVERRLLEEKSILEEEKVKEQLQAQREEEQRIQEEREALEAAQAAEEARKNLLIQPLDPKWVAIVSDALSTTNPQRVFSKGPDGSDVTRYMLGRILPPEVLLQQEGEKEVTGGSKGTLHEDWLNDECVDIWIAMIVARRLEQQGYVKGPSNTPLMASYLSAFWKTYKERGVKGINSWSRRKGISGKKLLGVDKVFFPINTGLHWILLVISPKSHTIEVFDSLGGSPASCLKFAREWLAMELGESYNPDDWNYNPVESEQQLNSNDCGVFTCINALASAKDQPPKAVVSTDGMYDARSMMVAVLINGGFKDDWEL